MKKIIFILLILCIGLFSLQAQDLRPIGRDLSTMMEGIGNDIAPYLQQTIIAGEMPGRASLGESRWFIGGNLGTTFTPGLFSFLEPGATTFELLNVNGLLNMATGSSGTFSSLFTTFQEIFFLPTCRLNAGVRLPWDLEVTVMFAIIPGVLTGAIAKSANLPGFELKQLNIGVRIRKTLMQDENGYPAISIGTGYSFGSFRFAYALGFSQAFDTYTLNLSGSLALDTKVHATGIDLMISKKLLIFFPYIKFSPWYQWTNCTGGIEGFAATFNDTATGTELVSSVSQGIAPGASVVIHDLSFIISGGIEIALGKFIITPGGSFNVNTKTFNAALNMRLQF